MSSPSNLNQQNSMENNESSMSEDESRDFDDNDDDEQRSDTNLVHDGYCLIGDESNVGCYQEMNENDPEEVFDRFVSQRLLSLEDRPPKIPSVNDSSDSTWSTKSQNESFPIDDDKVEHIKTLMSSFQLPAASVPEWAHYCPEENWQKILQERISCRQTTFFSNDEHDEK